MQVNKLVGVVAISGLASWPGVEGKWEKNSPRQLLHGGVGQVRRGPAARDACFHCPTPLHPMLHHGSVGSRLLTNPPCIRNPPTPGRSNFCAFRCPSLLPDIFAPCLEANEAARTPDSFLPWQPVPFLPLPDDLCTGGCPVDFEIASQPRLGARTECLTCQLGTHHVRSKFRCLTWCNFSVTHQDVFVHCIHYL